MGKGTYTLVLALLVCVLAPMAANAAGTVTVYFNSAGTVRSIDSPGVGAFQTVHIYGEGFPGQFISGAQYKVDYGPNFTWVQDIPEGGIVIGNSPNGISIGFGNNIKFGAKFKTQRAILIWNSDCETTGAVNGNLSVVEHPDFPDATPIFTNFPDQSVLTADGRRSQICQRVEVDIHPGSCPNPLTANLWNFLGGKPGNGGVLPVALLGSSTFDVDDVNLSSLLLEGVAPLSIPPVVLADVGGGDGDNDCACDFSGGKDGVKDISMKFSRVAIAAAIGSEAPAAGTIVTLTLTGAYNDGMPFKGTDCVVIVGNVTKKDGFSGAPAFSTSLSNPTPNPFNPVTWITYTIPSSQHVRIAIYDVAGRLVENVVDEVKAPGEYTVEWDAANRPSGVYFYRMQTGDQTIVRRATLLK